jgi:CBS domain-containing membrane protein
MTPDVLTVRMDDDVLAAQELMYDRNIRHVLVVDDEGALAGLVSDRDLLSRALPSEVDLPLTTRRDLLGRLKVREVMTADVETIDVDDPVDAAAQLMLERKYGCLPVLEEGLLAGILTEADFVRYVADGRQVGDR